MKTIISIGTDGKILEGGRVFDRVREYANLVDVKYYCYVFTNDDKKVKYEIVHGKFVAKAIYGESKFKQIINLFSNIRNLRKEGKMEIIWYPQDSFEIGLISLVVKFLFGGKLYAQCHTDLSHSNFRNLSFRNYIQFLIAQLVFRKADKIRVVSQRMKNYLVDSLEIDEKKILSLPIYYDGEVNVGDTLPTTDFLIMSRIEKEKNIETAIEAVRKINQERKIKGEKDLTLKIVGSGSYKRSLQKKNTGDEYNFITWSDWTDNPMQEYKNVKYFLLPSFYEGWALTAVESVACGTPVIMTPVGCAHEFIQDYKNGIVSNGFDVKSFSEAIKKALTTDISKENVSRTVLELDTKREYLDKLKKFLNE
jgi:glycosyltransferase involved in cell wall biosynthesis